MKAILDCSHGDELMRRSHHLPEDGDLRRGDAFRGGLQLVEESGQVRVQDDQVALDGLVVRRDPARARRRRQGGASRLTAPRPANGADDVARRAVGAGRGEGERPPAGDLR
jgi:hypothetical protein